MSQFDKYIKIAQEIINETETSEKTVKLPTRVKLRTLAEVKREHEEQLERKKRRIELEEIMKSQKKELEEIQKKIKEPELNEKIKQTINDLENKITAAIERISFS